VELARAFASLHFARVRTRRAIRSIATTAYFVSTTTTDARACDDDEVDADVRDVTHKNYNYVERRFHPIPGLAPHAFVTSAFRLKARACPPATRRRDAEGVRPD